MKTKLFIFFILVSVSFLGCKKELPDGLFTLLTLGKSHGGGIVFDIDSTGQHGLVITAIDQGSVKWGCENVFFNLSQVGNDTDSGQENTLKIIDSCSEAGIAARIANDLLLNGFDDWFLPSMKEWQMIRENLFERVDLKDFTGYYWSSSDCSMSQAAVYSFTSTNSGPYCLGKDSLCKLRCIRKF